MHLSDRMSSAILNYTSNSDLRLGLPFPWKNRVPPSFQSHDLAGTQELATLGQWQAQPAVPQLHTRLVSPTWSCGTSAHVPSSSSPQCLAACARPAHAEGGHSFQHQVDTEGREHLLCMLAGCEWCPSPQYLGDTEGKDLCACISQECLWAEQGHLGLPPVHMSVWHICRGSTALCQAD